jgi:hypothetical protein
MSMSEIAPYLIDTGYVELPTSFLLPIFTTQERFDMIISALLVGGEILYGEDEILHFVDFLDALPDVRDYDLMSYDDLVAGIAAAQADADAALAQIAAFPVEKDFSLYADEGSLIADSAALAINSAFAYGVMQFTSGSFAAIRWHKVADLSSGGTFKIWYSKFPTGGVSTLAVNGVSVGTLNQYQGTTVHNFLATFTLAASIHGKARHQIDFSNTGVGTGGGSGQGMAKIWFISN